MTKSGIITIFTADLIVDFKVFYYSLKRHSDIDLYVMPVGLSDEELRWLHSLKVIIYKPTVDYAKKYPHCAAKWMQWFKPLIIQSIIRLYDLTRVVWLDVDLVVLSSLEPLLDHMNAKLLLMRDEFAPKYCLNQPSIYNDLDIKLDERYEDLAINSGVVGFLFPRDEHILDSWCEYSEKIAPHHSWLKKITLLDQGILLLVLHSKKLYNLALQKPQFNHNAKRNAYHYHFYSDTTDLLSIIGADNPKATIAHYAGLPKLSHLCVLNHPLSIKNLHIWHGKSTDILFILHFDVVKAFELVTAIRKSSLKPCSTPVSCPRQLVGLKSLLNTVPLTEEYARTDVSLIGDCDHSLFSNIAGLLACHEDAKAIIFLDDLMPIIDSIISNNVCLLEILSIDDLCKSLLETFQLLAVAIKTIDTSRCVIIWNNNYNIVKKTLLKWYANKLNVNVLVSLIPNTASPKPSCIKHNLNHYVHQWHKINAEVLKHHAPVYHS